jgi:DNA-binding IclR family transcriptional regulator
MAEFRNAKPCSALLTGTLGSGAIAVNRWTLPILATRGFTVSVGEWQPDVSAVGVPLIPGDGPGVFAFNCGGPAFQINKERLETEIGPRLVNMVRNVEAALNGH